MMIEVLDSAIRSLEAKLRFAMGDVESGYNNLDIESAIDILERAKWDDSE